MGKKNNSRTVEDTIKRQLWKSAYKVALDNPDVPIDVVIEQVFLNFLGKSYQSWNKIRKQVGSKSRVKKECKKEGKEAKKSGYHTSDWGSMKVEAEDRKEWEKRRKKVKKSMSELFLDGLQEIAKAKKYTIKDALQDVATDKLGVDDVIEKLPDVKRDDFLKQLREKKKELKKRAPKGVDKQKYESCVKQVKKQGKVDNPYAVCASSLKGK